MFREVARKKQVLTEDQIKEVLKAGKRGVLSLLGDYGYPYGVPINYLYEEESGKIYFHSGKNGHKIDSLKSCNKVSFCVYDEGYRAEGEWALNFKSVIIFGKISVVDDFQKSMDICRRLSLKFTDDEEYIRSEIEKFGKNTLCLELSPEHITGKTINEA
jgi:nitroimidazol reductase NimA-like FMN-containing flavoprotein (pyridoxamine 5'-phosphate oxidase superfamily)